MSNPSDNHQKAPICAEFVRQMREVFGEDVKVTYVKEGELTLGEPIDQSGPLSEVRDNVDPANARAERQVPRSGAGDLRTERLAAEYGKETWRVRVEAID